LTAFIRNTVIHTSLYENYFSMNFIDRVFSFFKLSVEEKEIYQNEISQENARRALFLSLIAIPVSLVHIILFALRLKGVTGTEHLWVISIIYAHITIVILTSISSTLLYFFFYRTKKNNLFAKICTNVILFFLLAMGAVIATVDQYVTAAITPFFVATMVVSLIFLMRPFFSTIYYIASYVVFYVAIAQTQLNQEVLISNQVNGLSITAIGLCLSFILWHSNMTRVKQSRQITRQNKALVDSNAEKDKFFSIIAHDLKSPFTSILGFSNLLAEQVRDKDYKGIDQYATVIQQSSKKAMDLLMNLMEWSQAQTGRMAFNPEKFELMELIRDTELLFAGALQQKKISLTITVSSNSFVFADRNMISTVMRNLFSNAIKFTYEGGHIRVLVVTDQQLLTVSIADSGVGIPKESMDKLFRIDQSYSTPGTQDEKGTGLGLILCKELIEKHAGKIWGESELGKGSTFYFTLPANAANADYNEK
jgi:two-component system, sensor histidine kinase and response regulator